MKQSSSGYVSFIFELMSVSDLVTMMQCDVPPVKLHVVVLAIVWSWYTGTRNNFVRTWMLGFEKCFDKP